MQFRNCMQYFIAICAFFSACYATSIDTTSGLLLDTSQFVIDYWALDANFNETAVGAIAFTQGLRTTGTGWVWLDVAYPIYQTLDMSNATGNIKLYGDLHLADKVILQCNEPYGIIKTPVDQPRKVIYLDGNVTLSGNNSKSGGDISGLVLENVILDGQGHTLFLGQTPQGGALIIGSNVTLRNVTIKHAWCDQTSGSFLLFEGTVLPEAATMDCILQNMTFEQRVGQPLSFGRIPTALERRIVIDGTVTFKGAVGNEHPWGEYYGVRDGEFNVPIIVHDQSSLIVESGALLRGWYTSPSYGPFYQHDVGIYFDSDSSRLILNDSVYGVYNPANSRAGYDGMLELTTTLTRGTLIVRGASQLRVDAQLLKGGRSVLFIGDNNVADDFNIIIDPGARLDVIGTNTNCSVVFRNVH